MSLYLSQSLFQAKSPEFYQVHRADAEGFRLLYVFISLLLFSPSVFIFLSLLAVFLSCFPSLLRLFFPSNRTSPTALKVLVLLSVSKSGHATGTASFNLIKDNSFRWIESIPLKL